MRPCDCVKSPLVARNNEIVGKEGLCRKFGVLDRDDWKFINSCETSAEGRRSGRPQVVSDWYHQREADFLRTGMNQFTDSRRKRSRQFPRISGGLQACMARHSVFPL